MEQLQESLGKSARPLRLCYLIFILRFLKEKDSSIQIILADPTGSSLFNKVKYNVCYTYQQAEKTLKKHRYDSIVEGVGLDRITKNFNLGLIDDAYQVNDQELLYIAHWILNHESLLIGSSTALNIGGIIKSLTQFPEGSNLVTICCDQGNRHLSRFWNPEYVQTYQLKYPDHIEVIEQEFAQLFTRQSKL